MTPEQRREFLAIANRRARAGSGTDPLVLRERTAHYGLPDLQFLVGRIEFAVVGGLATRLYMPERMTLDADIIVRASDLPATESCLREARCRKVGPLAIGGSVWKTPGGWALDVMALDEQWIDDALHTTVKGPNGLPYVALHYLVVMKLASSRAQDLADISRMLGETDGPTLEIVRRAVARHRPQDAEDLESLIRLGRLEFESPQGE